MFRKQVFLEHGGEADQRNAQGFGNGFGALRVPETLSLAPSIFEQPPQSTQKQNRPRKTRGRCDSWSQARLEMIGDARLQLIEI